MSVASNQKAGEEIKFYCKFSVDNVHDDMCEEDIYNISRVKISRGDIFNPTEMETKNIPNVRTIVVHNTSYPCTCSLCCM